MIPESSIPGVDYRLSSGPAGPFVAAGLVASFGLLWAVIEGIASLTDVSIEQLVWTRYAIHLLVLLLVFGRRHRSSLVRAKRPLLQAGRSLLMLGMPLCFFGAVKSMAVNDTLAVFWTALLAVLLVPGRYRSLARLTAGVAAYIGVLLVLHPTAGVLHMGTVFALGMGACFVGYLWLTEILSSDSTLTNLFHSALWVFATLSVRMPFVWRRPSLRAWVAMAAVGILGLVALCLLDIAVRIGGPAAFTPTLYLEPVFTILCGVGFAGSGIRPELGALVIVMATIAAIAAGPLQRFPVANKTSPTP